MKASLTILQLFLSDLRRSPGSALASVLAIAAGVALFIAVHVAGGAARSSFVSAVEAVSGKATHEVSRPGGLDPARLTEFLGHEAVRAAQPVVESHVLVTAIESEAPAPGETLPPLRLLGIDALRVSNFLSSDPDSPLIPGDQFQAFLTRPATAIVSEAWARESAVEVGARIDIASAGRTSTLEIIAIFPLDALGEAVRDTALVDIATAQEVLGRTGSIDRIDLIVERDGEDAVRSLLTGGELLERPENRGERVARMVDAFRLNLAALGSLAMIVGALLVYNAGQFRVVRRSHLLGQLRCLGVESGQLRGAILAEILVFGLVGGVLGLGLGLLLAQGLAGQVARTVTEIYAFVRVETTSLSPALALATLAATVAVSLLAGWLPAADAARVSPKQIGQRSREETSYRGQLPRLTIASVIAALLGVLVLEVEARSWWTGIAAALLFLVSAASALPPVLGLTLPALLSLSERLGFRLVPIALGAVHRSLSRTAGAAAALGISLGMTVGVIIMVTSFQKEVIRWVENNLQADIYIGDAAERVSRSSARIPDEYVESLRRREGVAAVDVLRGLELPLGGRSFFMTGVDLHERSHSNHLEFLRGDASRAREALRSGKAVISEPLATRHQLDVGDRLVVPGQAGEVSFEIAGVFRDYSYDRGYASISHRHYLEAFGETGIRNAGVYLEPGVESDALAASLRREVPAGLFLTIRSNAQLRAEVLDIFDRTFALTFLLQGIATILALAGVGVTLYSLFLERAREIATLRSIGASLGQILRLLMVESLSLALYPVALALPLGAVLAWILITVVNQRAFGWSLPYHWPGADVLWTCLLALGAGLIATIAPWRAARRQSLAQILREP